MSGAGKSVALHALEDMGLLAVDNLPLQLIPHLADLYHESGVRIRQIAVGVDVRVGSLLEDFTKSLQDLSRRGVTYQIIFMEAADEILQRRFSETRRRHPLGKSVRLGIREERRRTNQIREIADRIIDTSHTNPNELKNVLLRVTRLRKPRSMAITVTSFGYKYGMPIDADIVLDVRFLPNPNYVRRFKPLTGAHPKVSDYVLRNPLTKKFMQSVRHMLDITVPQYQKEGKSYLTVAIGCTGGRHRSVALAEHLKAYLQAQKLPVRVIHRDVNL